MKKYIRTSSGNLDNLPDGRYLVKYGKAYYQLSFDFHNCTYAIDPVGDTKGRSEYFLSREEVDDIINKGGYNVVVINNHPYS